MEIYSCWVQYEGEELWAVYAQFEGGTHAGVAPGKKAARGLLMQYAPRIVDRYQDKSGKVENYESDLPNNWWKVWTIHHYEKGTVRPSNGHVSLVPRGEQEEKEILRLISLGTLSGAQKGRIMDALLE